MIWLLGASPWEGYKALFSGAFGGRSELADTALKATPLLLVGTGICIAFRARVINVGGEGQILLGALLSTVTALGLGDLPGPILLPLVLVGGMVGGGVWGAIPGALKAYLGVNEILSTIMLNIVAVQLVTFLLRGPLIDPEQDAAGRDPPDRSGSRPTPTCRSSSTGPACISASCSPWRWRSPRGSSCGRSTVGYRIRAVGAGPDAARYAGITVRSMTMLALTVSGALCGLAGAILVFGSEGHRFVSDGSSTGFTGSAGFNGIVAALFGALHPLWTIPASFLFGGLLVGANAMQRAIQIPSSLVVALNGIVVLFVVASVDVRRRLLRRFPAADGTARSWRTSTCPVGRVGGGSRVSEFFTVSVLVATVASAVRLTTPYAFAALGETLGQRSGVLNLGVDGVMLLGAFFAYWVALEQQNLWLAVLAGAAVGTVMGIVYAIVTLVFHGEQGISGIGVYLFGLGLSELLYRQHIGTPLPAPTLKRWEIPVLGDIPEVGTMFFDHSLLVYAAVLLVPLLALVINHTRFGLNVRAVGENPEAADSRGVSVNRHAHRYHPRRQHAGRCGGSGAGPGDRHVPAEPHERHRLHRRGPRVLRVVAAVVGLRRAPSSTGCSTPRSTSSRRWASSPAARRAWPRPPRRCSRSLALVVISRRRSEQPAALTLPFIRGG